MSSSFFTIRDISKANFISILPFFLLEIQEDFQLLSEVITNNQLQSASGVVHKMKGTSQVYGANSIVELLMEFEIILNTANLKNINNQMSTIEGEIKEAVRIAQIEFQLN